MPFRTEHRIGVAAPPDVIWDILADLDGWTRWNPLYPRAEGRLLIDAKLSLDMKLEGEALSKVEGQVIDWTPNSLIHWREKSGLTTTTRYLEIDKLSEEGCIFSNGVLVEGPLTRFVTKAHKHRLRAGFTAMGEAMKREAEAAWAARVAAGEVRVPA